MRDAFVECDQRNCRVVARGNVAVRVAPQDLNKFLDFVGKQGKISQHSTESEDKTAAVVDVEAKIKNQTSLRKMPRPASALPTFCEFRKNLPKRRPSSTAKPHSAKFSQTKPKKFLSKLRSAPSSAPPAAAPSRPSAMRFANRVRCSRKVSRRSSPPSPQSFLG